MPVSSSGVGGRQSEGTPALGHASRRVGAPTKAAAKKKQFGSKEAGNIIRHLRFVLFDWSLTHPLPRMGGEAGRETGPGRDPSRAGSPAGRRLLPLGPVPPGESRSPRAVKPAFPARPVGGDGHHGRRKLGRPRAQQGRESCERCRQGAWRRMPLGARGAAALSVRRVLRAFKAFKLASRSTGVGRAGSGAAGWSRRMVRGCCWQPSAGPKRVLACHFTRAVPA